MIAALYCEPDAYLVDGRPLVGRRAAGSAFLRAAVEGRGNLPLVLYGGRRQGADEVAKAARAIDSTVKTQWIPQQRTDMLERVGTLFRPDPGIGRDARLRLRRHPAAYSLCGVTHTLSSSRALEIIADYATDPLMAWDALICTSTAALGVVRNMLDATLDYHRWRFGANCAPELPQLPIIPLGIHCGDFAVTAAGRQAARATLGLEEDEVAVLFAGRLSLSTKAHPYPMYQALRAVAEQSGRRLVLVQAGQFFTEAASEVLREAADRHCPGVRALFVDGADPALYAAAFRGADMFLSLADSMQETFGITPVEAMASGLPVVVTDWNGYRDTVRDGIDGFRITTRAPGIGGAGLATVYEMGAAYETYCAAVSGAVSVDVAQLIERLSTLVGDADLRRRMGEAGRKRARAEYDWSAVYPRYRALWAELGARRRAARVEGAPAAYPVHQDPFRTFAHYPSRPIGIGTLAAAAPGASAEAAAALAADRIFQHLQVPADQGGRMIAAAPTPRPVGELAAELGLEPGAAILLAGQLAKMNLLLLSDPSAASGD